MSLADGSWHHVHAQVHPLPAMIAQNNARALLLVHTVSAGVADPFWAQCTDVAVLVPLPREALRVHLHSQPIS